MKLVKQIEHVVNINALSHDGRGIARIDGKTIFVDGALVGETVTCQITKKHSRYWEGKALTIITAAPERTLPPCPHFGICGGCSMQHVQIDSQITLKQAILLEQLHHFGHVKPTEILPPITGDSLGYRRKARLGVRFVNKKNKMLVGFREKWSNYLADIQSCAILHASVGTRLEEISHAIRKLTQYLHVPQIEVAVGDNAAALVIRHLAPLPLTDIEILRAFGHAHQLHVYLQPNAPEKIQKIWPQNDEGLYYYLSDFHLKMAFHPLDFTQVNREVNSLMIKQALQLLSLKSTDHVLDLFCGLGNFTLPIAQVAQQVHGVEGSKDMVERAEINAQSNHLNNTVFFAANLMAPSEYASWLQQSYDKILLDPPRSGAKEILPFLPRLGAKKIVYVSCNPATLARDARELVHTYHYKLEKIGVINMFPHTSHIEAIALFEK